MLLMPYALKLLIPFVLEASNYIFQWYDQHSNIEINFQCQFYLQEVDFNH